MSPSTLEVMLCSRLEKKPPLLVVPPEGMTSEMKFWPMRDVLSCGALAWGTREERGAHGQDRVRGHEGRF
jgi:hypothetical protein